MARGNPCARTSTATPRIIGFPWATSGSNGLSLRQSFSSFCWGVMALLHVPYAYEVLALCTLLGWPILMFSYLHDRMHVEDFWMTRVPCLRTWFLKARRLHDIHHKSLDSKGFMDTNFGIGFFFFDRFFGTIARRHRPLNWCGY